MMTTTRTFKSLLSVALLAFAISAASAQTPAPAAAAPKQTPPPGGPPKAFNVPAHETYALPNGMRVTLVPYGNIPKVDISLSIRAGNINDPRGVLGVADIAGEMLKEGTQTLSAKTLAETIAGMGSSLDLRVGEDETAVDVDVLSEYDAAAIKLLADFAMHPLMPESELPRLKANLMRQVVVSKTRPGQIALARFRKLMYGDHAYGDILPTEESLNKMTIEDVRKFYAENYGAERAHLYVAGKFNVADAKKAIAESFSGWTKGTPPAVNAPKPKTQRLLDVTDRPNAPQSTIYVGLPVADATSPDNISLLVTNSLLGGSFGSRITTNIREQKGYTYSPSSQVSRRYHDAYWVEIADVTTASTGPALKEIFGEVDRLQKEPPSATELKGIQSYLSGVFVIQNSTRQALIGQLRYVDLQGLGEDYLKTFVQKVNAVTPEDVQHMTAKYIKPDQMTIVVVGDKSKITEQLTLFASAGGTSK
ncbi:MAG: insulinase family protein [Acidobacteriota bacterium]|nr:insulinase family protein [Acidobacteriota bacterium]